MFRSLLRNAVSVSRRLVVRRQVSTSRFFSSQGEGEEKTTIGRIDLSDKSTRMGIRFRCGVCRHSLSKTFNRQSYEQGLVIIRCDSCENLHLIADNIGWFKDLTNDGKTRNIVEMLKAKGEKIHRVRVDPNSKDKSTIDEQNVLVEELE